MGLKEEFHTIDGSQLLRVAESVQDKLVSDSPEPVIMFDTTFDEYPSFTELICFLVDKYESKEHLNPKERHAAIVGAGTVLLTLREYIKVQEMREQFPDAPEA